MIKEESQDGDFLFSHADAGPHSLFVRVRNIRLIPSLECDSMVAHFPSFPKKNGKCAKEETAARSFRPEIWRPSADGMKLAHCARSDSHPVRALRAVKSRPCGAGLHSNGRGAAPVLSCLVSHGAVTGPFQKFSAQVAQTQMSRFSLFSSRTVPFLPAQRCVLLLRAKTSLSFP